MLARGLCGALVLWAVLPAAAPAAAAGQAPARPDALRNQVRAVLFYSPACPHCHDVMRDHLPPLLQEHGDALRIVAINVDTPEGQALYRAVARHFELPRERLGVPALVVGDQIMVGAWEIPSLLPALVRAGLEGTGVDWPPIPEVRSFLALQGIAAGPTVVLEPWMLASGAPGGGGVARFLQAAGAGWRVSLSERFARDPLGNGVAVAVLVAMLAVLLLSVRSILRPRRLAQWPAWTIPALAGVGTAIAVYLSYVEVTGAEAVCGPVGDCNRVQQSEFAAVAGIPVGVLGVLGYLALGGLWVAIRMPVPAARRIPLLVWGAAAVGVAFSAYLTFLEPFVIGATCIWCINSAVVMTLILMAATPDAARVRLER